MVELKAVIFDLGGTLIYYPFLTEIRMVCQQHWKEIGLDQEILLRMYEVYVEERKKSFQTLKEVALSDSLLQALKEAGRSLESLKFKEVLRNIHYFQDIESAYLYPGAAKALRGIKELNLKVGLISNTPFPGEFHEKNLKRFRISKYFDVKVWSCELGWRKPNPVIYFEALYHLQVKPWEAIYVGDRFDRDVEGPNKIRMPAIWISHEEKREFLGWQVKEIKEVIEIVQTLQ